MAIFTNQATLTYNGNTTTSNVTTGELLEVLSATKTAVSSSYAPDDRVTYVLSIVNSGSTAFTGLTVTDDLGGYTFGTETLTPLTYIDGSVRYYISGMLQPAPTVTAGPPLVISGINVPAGGNAILVYEAQVNSLAPADVEGVITNTALISGGGLSADISVSETISAAAGPRLTISKSICPPTVAENGQLTYTFVIQNSGNTPAAAADNVAVTDTFDPILDPITVTLDGQPLTAPADYTYDTATGLFATVPGRITVPAATYTQDPVTGARTVNPGVAVLTVSGTV